MWITALSDARTGLLSSGMPQEKFDALAEYNCGVVTARLLAYLGGFEASTVG